MIASAFCVDSKYDPARFVHVAPIDSMNSDSSLESLPAAGPAADAAEEK